MPIRVRASRPATASIPRATAALPFGLCKPPADWPQRESGISLCMIVKNEERFLEQCLASAAGIVDEINIVDTGSTDGTLRIAEKYGARIEHREWRSDFAWARNESLKMATKRWILQLDADEELLPESFAALETLKTAPAYDLGVWLRCFNASDRYKGGGMISHAIIRIFPNNERIRFKGAIHEFPSLDDSPLSIKGVAAPISIVHHGYLNEIVADRNKYARNLRIIEQSVKSEPEDAFHWYNLGMTQHLGGEQQQAAQALTHMWDLCKKHGMRAFAANGLQTLADVYSEHLGQPEKGLAYALECIEHSPRYANAHFSAGKAYFLLQRFDEAREMYEKAIADAAYLDRQFVVDDEVPKWKAQCEIGTIYAEQGDHVKALEWFERGLVNRPQIQPLRINRANSLEALGRFTEAEAVFRSVFEDFGDEQSTVRLVNYLLRRQKEREALELIDRTYANVSGEAAVQMLLAAALVTQRLGWGDGERHLVEAQRIDPDSAQVRAALDALYKNRGEVGALFARVQGAAGENRFEEARELAEQGVAGFPQDARFSYFAALACANLDRKDEALRHLDRIQDASAGEGPEFLRAAILRERGCHAQALASVERVLERNPSNLDALLVKAAIFDSLSRSSDAETTLLSALPLDKKRVAVELAGLYLRGGRLADAKRVAEEALT